MKTVRISILTALATLCTAAVTYAFPIATNNYNGLFFKNSEVLINTDNSVDPLTGRATVTTGDVFWGVFSVQNAINAGNDSSGQTGTEIWPQFPQVPPAEVTGYFATQVTAINPSATPGFGTLVFGSVADPNGKLAAGEVLRFYESNTTKNFNDTTQGQALATATDGTAIAGLSLDNGGYWYTPDAPTTVPSGTGNAISRAIGTSYAGLNFTFSPWLVDKINDPNEVFINSLVDLFFNSEVFRLPDTTTPNVIELGANQPMHFGSNDPAVFYPVPEPGTITLVGAGLIGVALFGRKRFAKK